MTWYSDLAARLKGIFGSVPGGEFDWQTAGPAEDEHPPVNGSDHTAALWGPGWSAGWWLGPSQRRPLHPGRLGPAIIPRAVVVHTTDTLGGFDALVQSWTTTPGARNAAHFLIGRSPSEGVVQFAPITRNANHAGGRPHGMFRAVGTGDMHPNTVAVGIELLAGGRLKKVGGSWVHPDSGRFVPAAEVFLDEHLQGWHLVTDYQLKTLQMLLTALRTQLQTVWNGNGCRAMPDASYASQGVAYYAAGFENLVGHVSLDPVNKTDPGPQVMRWLAEYAAT